MFKNDPSDSRWCWCCSGELYFSKHPKIVRPLDLSRASFKHCEKSSRLILLYFCWFLLISKEHTYSIHSFGGFFSSEDVSRVVGWDESTLPLKSWVKDWPRENEMPIPSGNEGNAIFYVPFWSEGRSDKRRPVAMQGFRKIVQFFCGVCRPPSCPCLAWLGSLMKIGGNLERMRFSW